jgi:hypothetical protein
MFGNRVVNSCLNADWGVNKIIRIEADVYYNYKGDKIVDDPYEEQSTVPILQILLSEQALVAFELRFDFSK